MFVDAFAKGKQMVEIKQEALRKKEQMMQMEARIKKLHIEEDKAKKKINDAKKQQESIVTQRREKEIALEMKERHLREQQQKEEHNRMKIIEDRALNRQRLSCSLQMRSAKNKEVCKEIKEQKNRIKYSIEQSKFTYKEDKQRALQVRRDELSKNQQFKATLNGSFMNSTAQQFQDKMDKTKREAIEYEVRMRELEHEEQAMIQRLTQTQKIESAEKMRLLDLKKKQSSPLKASLARIPEGQEINASDDFQRQTTEETPTKSV